MNYHVTKLISGIAATPFQPRPYFKLERTAHGHLMPRSSMCIMDFPALWTIPFCMGMNSPASGLVHVRIGMDLPIRYTANVFGLQPASLALWVSQF